MKIRVLHFASWRGHQLEDEEKVLTGGALVMSAAVGVDTA
jgi:hypothetical protein